MSKERASLGRGEGGSSYLTAALCHSLSLVSICLIETPGLLLHSLLPLLQHLPAFMIAAIHLWLHLPAFLTATVHLVLHMQPISARAVPTITAVGGIVLAVLRVLRQNVSGPCVCCMEPLDQRQ